MADASTYRDLFTGFGFAPLPDAVEAFLFHAGNTPGASGFERYAARLFQGIDIERLRAVCDGREVVIAYIARMESFYLNFDRTKATDEDRLLLYQVETVLNRLSRLIDAIGDTEPSEEACSLLDMRCLREVVLGARGAFEQAGERNPWGCPGTRACKPGGEWDVRSRLASICEGLATITRLDYSFDCDAAAGLVELRFTAPDESAMPHVVWDEDGSCWRAVTVDERRGLCSDHTARMALMLSSAAFAAGTGVKMWSVTVLDPIDARPRRTYRFERTSFVAEVAPKIAGLAKAPLGVRAAAALLEPLRGEPVLARDADDPLWTQVAHDDRPLPGPLRDLLLADRMSELDVMEPENSPSMQRFRDIQAVEMSDPAAALKGFRELVGALEGECAAAELASPVPLQSQFCENLLGRIMAPELMCRPDGEPDTTARIRRAPDALYFAQYEIVQLLQRMGRYEEALEEARRMADIASTSTQAHFTLVNISARMGLYNDVVEICRHGMRIAYERAATAYYLYRMAFAYWCLGKRELALACYAMVPEGEQVSEVAANEMHTLMAEMGLTRPPSFQQAAAVVRDAGIPAGPNGNVSDRIADVAVLLTDAGFFALAQGCVNYLWHALGSDELGAISRSLQRPGAAAPAAPAATAGPADE